MWLARWACLLQKADIGCADVQPRMLLCMRTEFCTVVQKDRVSVEVHTNTTTSSYLALQPAACMSLAQEVEAAQAQARLLLQRRIGKLVAAKRLAARVEAEVAVLRAKVRYYPCLWRPLLGCVQAWPWHDSHVLHWSLN
jgi:hypothetical protein